jgi:small conductance mechanosensitive channel
MKEELIIKYSGIALDYVIMMAPKVIMAIIALIAGFWAVKKIKIVVDSATEKAKLNEQIRPFLLSFVEMASKCAVIMIAASFVGINFSALFGILTAATFAIGMALQGSMSHFASGILIMVLKPFKANDIVEIFGKFGRVEKIDIFNTKLITPGNKLMIIPNGKIMENSIINYTENGSLRIEFMVDIPNTYPYEEVKSDIAKSLGELSVILDTPEMEIGIETFDAHRYTLRVRPYVHASQFWDGIFQGQEAIKLLFDQKDIDGRCRHLLVEKK